MKKIISLIISVCMLIGIFGNMNVFASESASVYGEIPTEYQDAEKYPFVAFIDGEFAGAATHYSDKDVAVVDSVIDIAYKNLVGETKANVTLNVLLRRDYEMASANGDAYSGIQGLIGGHMVLDLDSHHLNAQMGMFNLGVRHGWDSTLKKNSLYDAYATVKNGTVTVKDSNLGHTTIAGGIDQYEKIRNTYVTYENVKFKTGATCSGVPFVQSNTVAPTQNPANLYVTYTNCAFDVSNATNSMTLFDVKDSKDKYNGHIRLNGGKIIVNKLGSVAIASLNESGTDSFTVDKYEGEYPELVAKQGTAPANAFNTADGSEMYFMESGKDGDNTIYSLCEKTKYGVVPKAYEDKEKYPFLAFIDGEFIGAATHYSDTATADMNSVIDYAYANIRGESKANTTLNVLLRRDYTVSTANGDANNNAQGQLGGRLVIDLDGHKMDVQQSLFYVAVAHGWDGTLKKNSLYDAYAMVKNGSITISNNLIMYWLGSSIDSYENIKNSYYTFENVKFDVNTNTSRNVFVGANGASNTKNYGKLHVTFDNCEFDLKGRKDWFTLFNLNDANDKHHTTIKINGGRLVSNNLSGVTMVTLNESGTDSFIFGKYNDSYPELVLSLGSNAMTAGFDTTDDGISYFGVYSTDEENTIYRLGKKSGSTVIPYDKISEIADYNSETFTATVKTAEDGKFVLIFARYNGTLLEKVDVTEYEFTKGVTVNLMQKDKSFVLGKGDQVMLWRDMTACVPVCEAYTVK